MSGEDEFRIRPGRVRSRGAQRARPFVAQALAAAQKAGGSVSRSGRVRTGRSRLGKGQRAALQANRFITARSRGAVVKARVVRQAGRAASLGVHLTYLRREGVTRDGENARLFGPETENADAGAFGERCAGDRHHFRFIVSPDDATEMSDLRGFTRDLMRQAERDLGTKLDWVGVDHWNTGHPHIHAIVRGVRDDGADLVISRDYISAGMRDRARDLITHELGPRTEHDIRQSLERQVDAERWTNLDRQFVRDSDATGILDMAPRSGEQPDAFHTLKVGRLRKLQSLGLADEVGPGQWIVADDAQATLRELGERGDIIKRIHRGLAERGVDRGVGSYVLAGEDLPEPLVGRLIARGLDDELTGTAYAVIDATDGRTHHVRLPDLDAAGDGSPRSIIELRRYEDRKGNKRSALAVRSDLSIEAQVTATGATWLDRQAIAREPAALGGGFGAEVRDAIERRIDHLAGLGLAERRAGRVVFARNLMDTLRRRELDDMGERIAAETGLPFRKAGEGEPVAGRYRQRLSLASGRFAMVDDGLGFRLVPWSPSMEKHLGQQVSGISRGGGVDWSFGRKRGLGI
ncbi:relaxase/mobilization nuclease domain-containing protein [Pararhizobium mangrovi]|uniref:DUF3363 domain-containing protein n=1 Tax=Pararhizobium mangrovi TaxID=2590452 RepID=A0A506U3U9_9HYPH|nr:VirD2 family relaxase/mobilization nuclease [Pararhizobium mangrovi]TPW27704.1 DUF3363 domain-containing protein [Pararhizobium mangrovi]